MSELWTPSTFSKDSETLNKLSAKALARGKSFGQEDNSELIAEMRKNRRVNAVKNKDFTKTADLVGGYSGGGGMSFATGRPQDPMFYWKQSNLPYDIWKEEELVIIRHYARLLYLTHPLIASAIDIFAKYPLQGLSIKCKDGELEDFYGTLFIDDLNYNDYLADILHEYWLAGEAWPLGQWNASLGIWEDDELMNPDDVDVIKTPFQKQPRFEMRLPEALRKILREREPKWEYDQLIKNYPELTHFMSDESRMPISDVILKQIAFKADTFHPRGIPILMRGFRAIFQEEMLNAAQDAVASRLYTPLILAKLGASATDLGTNVPWIPDAQDLAVFEEALDEALSGDFRILTHHFALDMESVFGREVMPDLGPDFDRLASRQLQVFGMSPTILNGAGEGETYAADALNLDVMSQLLERAQKLIKRFFYSRAKVVAEANEHFDYREENGQKYLIQEEVLKVNPETGEKTIIQQPKLLVPDLVIKSMDMKDEEQRQQIFDMARENGIAISARTRFSNIDIDLKSEMQMTKEEQVEMAVISEETRKETYIALSTRGLPIAQDLEQDFRPMAADSIDPRDAAEQMPLPNMVMMPPETMALTPTPEDYMETDDEDEEGDGMDGDNSAMPEPQVQGIVTPQSGQLPQRTEQSDQEKGDMPKGQKASMKKNAVLVKDAKSRIKRTAKVNVNPSAPDVKEGIHRLVTGPIQYEFEVI